MRSWLTKTVLILSIVSLMNDVSGELLYPVLPLYMASIGYGALWIGVLEGFAEATAGLTKGWFGDWSDRRGSRLPFVRIGYLLSAISKPLLPLFSSVYWAVFMRSSDRFGKGIRTGARDAMLADEAADGKHGKVFGFHRAMDTAGAFLGPLLALAWLSFHRDENYKSLFYLALIPGLICVLLLFLIKEKKYPKKGDGLPASPLAAFAYWKKASASYRKLITGIVLFTLFNSSDMFLLLLVKFIFPGGATIKLGIHSWQFSSDMLVVGFYIFYNLMYALFSYPAGALSDKFGPKRMLAVGYSCFALAYGGIAFAAMGYANHLLFVLGCFLIYGLFPAFTDGNSKAWISVVSGKQEKGLALGLFAGLTSIATLAASLTAGLIWTFISPPVVFLCSAAVAVLTVLYIIFSLEPPEKIKPA